jgi:hypothetical protein
MTRELDRLEIVLDQLERAELYVAAAMEVGLSDPDQRRELSMLRAQLVAVRRSLARPRVLDRPLTPAVGSRPPAR